MTAAPISLGRAWDVLDICLPAITTACPDLHAVEPAGDVRRVEALVASIVVVLCVDDPSAAADALSRNRALRPVSRRAAERLVATCRNTAVEILLATPADFGSTLLAATGSEAHLRGLRARGYDNDAYPTEDAAYASIGLPCIPPELREATGEIDAAAAGNLPALVEPAHVRGDLHMHTTYSDGRDEIDVMVAGCHALGYEYIAITDHSARSAAARTLSRDDIARQRQDIDRLRAQFPDMAILHGVEVDIMKDGRLDFDDATLEPFDFVLASLHDHGGHDTRRLTERSLAAIRHPLVNLLCHPANQLVGHFEGHALDFDELAAAAAETGTALEIDGAPSHMDLDGARARAAAAAGATLTIDSDCHRVEALGRQMRFGVGIARRGWIEPRHVLNTRPLADLREFVAAKRRR